MALPYDIEQLDSNTGLYIEEMGKIRTYHTEWHLITSIDLNMYHEDYFHLQNLIKQLRTKCSTTFAQIQRSCSIQVEHLEMVLSEINEYDTKWFMNSTSTRSKRALINMIGSALKTLFGVLSDDDAQLYAEKFEELEYRHLLHLQITEEQTTFIKSAINQINESFSLQNDRIQRIINDLYSKNLDEPRLRGFLNEYVQYVFMSLYAFQNKQKLLIEAISLGQSEPSNPLLLPPKIFYKELRNILTSISARNLDLPMQLNPSALAMFYHISTAEAAFANGHLIISFKLPLVNTEEYSLFKSTSLPYRVKDNVFSFIVPHHEYVALDRFKDRVIAITHEELMNCQQISNNNLICKRTFPVLYTLKTHICEVIVLRENYISDICNVRVSNLTSEMWIQMKQPNSFIYVLPQKQPIIFACGNITHSHMLSGTGVIRIQPNCEIKSDTLILNGFEIITSTLYHHINSSIIHNIYLENLLNDTIPIGKLDIPLIDYPNIINNGEYQELERISKSLKELRIRQLNMKHGLTPTNMKSNISTIIVVIIILSVFILLIKIRYAMKKVKKIRAYRQQMKPIIISPPSSTIDNQSNSSMPIQKDRVIPVFEKNRVTFEDNPEAIYTIPLKPTRARSCIMDEPIPK